MLESKLNLNFDLVEQARNHASKVADDTQRFIDRHTTVAVERTVCRLLGIDGVNSFEVPLPNMVVEHLTAKGALGQGVTFWIGNAMVETGKSTQEIAEAVADGSLDLTTLPTHSDAEIDKAIEPVVQESLKKIAARRTFLRYGCLKAQIPAAPHIRAVPSMPCCSSYSSGLRFFSESHESQLPREGQRSPAQRPFPFFRSLRCADLTVF